MSGQPLPTSVPSFLWAEILVNGITTTVPVTSVLPITQTQIFTDAYTMTRTLTIEEPLLDNAMTIFALVLFVVMVVATVMLTKRKRKS